MKDRFRIRAWDKVNKKYIYDAQFAEEFRYYVRSKLYEIEQCTDLKDKNDKLIYEGDILAKSKNAKPWDCYVVFWQDDTELQFQAVCYDGDFSYVSSLGELLEHKNDLDTEYQIIGNINENEELLEMMKYAK